MEGNSTEPCKEFPLQDTDEIRYIFVDQSSRKEAGILSELLAKVINSFLNNLSIFIF